MENKKMHPLKEDINRYDLIDKVNNVASYGECTGLIPTPPQSDEEADSYTDIYTVPNQGKSEEKVCKSKEEL